MVKNLPAMQETWIRSLGQEDSLEKGTAIHFSILAWKIPWMEEPGGLQSMESTRLSDFTSLHFSLAWRITWTEETDGLQFMGSQRVAHDSATNTHTLLLYNIVLASTFF